MLWRDSIIAKLTKGPQPLRPNFEFVAMEHMPANAVAAIEERLRQFIADRVEGLAGPLVGLQRALNRSSDDPEALSAGARGVAFRLVEIFGAMARRPIADDIKALSQDERAGLRKLGVRFGEYTLHMPALLKPAPAQFLGLLWSLWSDNNPSAFEQPPAGSTSVPASEKVPHAFWYAVGYRPSGERAVRIDMLERLAQEIRQAREKSGKEGFETNQRMMSLVGVSGDAFEDILKNLGYKKSTIERPVQPQPEPVLETPAPVAAEEPAAALEADATATETATAPVEASPAEVSATEAPTSETEAAPTDETASTEPAEPVVSEAAVPAKEPAPDADAQAPETEPTTETVTLWRYSPPNRKPRQGQGQRRGKPGHTDGQQKRGGPPKGKGGKRPPNKGGGKPKTFSSGPKREKQADPDSPFAVLASLKKD